MDPENIPFNALIVGATNCGKTSFLTEILSHEFLTYTYTYILYLPPDFRVAYTANISEHLPTQPHEK